MEEQNFQTSSSQTGRPPKQRPALLTLLCILTFIGSGIMGFSFFFVGLFHSTIVEMSNLPELNMPGIESIINTKPGVFLFGAFFYAISLAGAIFMWKLQKKGFHFYTLAQISLIYLSAFYLFPDRFPTGDIMISGSFIFFYGIFLREMD